MKEDEDMERMLAFFALYATPTNDGYLGAVLQTDNRGIPQEFRCTHPVKPTAIQKPLYGDALEAFIGVHLCGVPLFKSIRIKPSLVLVHIEHLLELREFLPYPVVYIRRAGEAIDVNPVAEKCSISERVRIDCTTGRFQPVVLIAHPEFNDDAAIAKDILENVFSYLDPIEPFDRMAKAIEVLCKQDKRFQ